MIDAPFAFAFAAGLVATVNPCGFAMLPAYLSYFMGLKGEEGAGRVGAMRQALIVGAVVSAGFLVVFGVAGVLITIGFRAIIDVIPWLALVIGGLVAILGIAMLRGFELTVGLPKAKSARKGRDFRSVFLFGISYAIASLSCTLPVFLTVVAGQVTRANFVSGVVTFVVYGLGMSLVLVGVTVALAFGKQSLVRSMRKSARYVNRVAGAILVAAGAYIVWFWATNISSGAEALGNSGPFRFVESLSAAAFRIIGEHPLAWGLGLGAAVTAAVLYVLFREDGTEPDAEATEAGIPVSAS
ncbi:MAG: cytochrome c biogenesis CcdA family protein, partial [Acidimicrobiia bacterium]